ncbi:MAG TPA: MFS transporter, partial [Candidatus Paceibacterota bacterium]|nr:MFS transporter [Candidatus Paceibacterota bacterium]
MIAPTTSTTSNPPPQNGMGMFRLPDGRSIFITFALVTSLFLLWGFCNGMIDILNKQFQVTLHINKQESGLVQFANYLGYFLMAVPAGLIARKFGYKGGILLGLVLIASGAFWMIHAVGIGTYSAFLLGLFVVAAGMTCLETIANPYTTVLGPPEHGATRINIAQTFNGVGWILGPIIGGYFVFGGGGGSGAATGTAASATNAVAATANAVATATNSVVADTTTNANAGLSTPYLLIGILSAVLIVAFILSQVPDLHAEDESKKSAELKTGIKPSSGQSAGIGVALVAVWGLLYFFIAPILGLVWALVNLPANLLDPTKYGLIVAAYIISFMVVAKNWDMFRRKHFTLGVIAQFLYVAAQTGIFSFCVNYIIENDPDVTPAKAATMLGGIGFVLFTVGRFFGSIVISQCKPHLVLAAYAAINVVLAAVCMGGGKVGLYAMFGTFFFMSVMYPTIFALGIRGLGDYTKLGSSLIVMS